jgi:GMP synthase-like glutamine amidotransferase
MRTPEILVLQHIVCEPPGAFEDELRARGLDLVRVELDEGEPLPDWRDFPAIIVMGGPMGAYDEADHEWLAPEKQLLREAVEADVPVWGVCLGAQLLASALGARVYTGDRPEVGVFPVDLTPAAAGDPVFGELPSSLPTLNWHGDTFDLPEDATLLASTAAYPHQAFRVGRSYGIQFHLEVTPALAAEWAKVPAYSEALEATLGPGALDRLLDEIATLEETTMPLARRVFGRWLEQVVRLPAAEAAR